MDGWMDGGGGVYVCMYTRVCTLPCAFARIMSWHGRSEGQLSGVSFPLQPWVLSTEVSCQVCAGTVGSSLDLP